MNETVIIPSLNILNVSLGDMNNSVEVQMGDVIAEEPENYTAQWIQHTGFCSLPPTAIANKSASEGMLLKRSDRDYVFASRDLLSQIIYGNLNPGEVTIYSAGADGTGQARVMLKGDGSISFYTTDDNTANGNALQLTLSPTTGLSFVSAFGSMTFDQAGFRVSTTSGASFNVMSTSDPTTGNAIMMSAGSCTINSGMITLGTPTNTAVPFGVVYGVLPVAAPGIPILGEGVGLVTMNAAASTSVFVGI